MNQEINYSLIKIKNSVSFNQIGSSYSIVGKKSIMGVDDIQVLRGELMIFFNSIDNSLNDSSFISINFRTSEKLISIEAIGPIWALIMVCLHPVFNVTNKSEAIEYFIKDKDSVTDSTLFNFIDGLYSFRGEMAKIDSVSRQDLDDIFTIIINKLTTHKSLSYRAIEKHNGNNIGLSVLERFAKYGFSQDRYTVLSDFKKEMGLSIFHTLLNNNFSSAGLKTKRYDYTAGDIAAFAENEYFIGALIKKFGSSCMEYFSKTKFQDYQIKDSNVRLAIESLYEKHALEKGIDAIAKNETVNKSKSKI